MERASSFGVKAPEGGDLGNHQVRLDLARQIKNKYRLMGDDPLAYLLEELASVPGFVLVRFSHDPVTDRRTASLLQGTERRKTEKPLFSRQTREAVVADSFNFHGLEKRPKGFFALQKKIGHFRVARAREGAQVESNFNEFESIKFADANVWQIQNRAAELISGIMLDPGTIIIRDMTTDIIDAHGRGVRIGNERNIALHFMGFVDTKLYNDPRRIP